MHNPPLAAAGSAALAGRIALITGASRGIGAATALRLAADGASVVLAARSAPALEGVAGEIRAVGGHATAVPTDLARAEDLDGLMEAVRAEHGRLDILVNNAGVLPRAQRAEQISWQAWQDVMSVNLTAPWYLSCRAKELMVAGDRPGGVIVNVTSTAASYPSVGLMHYNTSKAAVTMMSRGAALEWARDAVRVVAVAPGKVDTVLAEPILEYVEGRGEPLNPLRRIGRPDEVAELIAYLVSDRAAYVTGTVMTIDGGEVTGLASS